MMLMPLFFALTLSSPAAPAGIRELTCRGKPGIDLKITGRPSPDDPKLVRMTLRYTRSTAKLEDNLKALVPGTCTWNPYQFNGYPAEPGFVYFDIPPEAQEWFVNRTRQLDTTYLAATFFPDTISLPRYLNREDAYWRFFIDDQTNKSISFGAYKSAAVLPTYVTLTGPFGKSTPTVAELRCRGGAGISFNQGTRVGDNRIRMSMAYRIADREAGPDARGLAAGTCAYVKREGMPHELAKIDFETAGNAQIVQARTGGTVDRSPTAAVRYPDANTIPAYMQDPAHYWNFHVTVAQPTTATAHAAWRPTVGITTRKPGDAGQTSVAGLPKSAGDTRSSSGAKTSAVATLSKLTFKGVDRTLDGFRVRFTARPGAAATVAYSTSGAVSTPGGWYFPGAAVQGSGAVSRGGQAAEVSESKRSSAFSDYVGATRLPPQRGTNYNFIITVQGADGPVEQYLGKLKTMQMDVSVQLGEFTVLRKSFDQGVSHDYQLFCETPRGFVVCDGKNVQSTIGIMVYARPDFGDRDPNPTSWTVVSGKNSGIGKITIDPKLLRPDRFVRSFTIRSMPGDIEFEVQGNLNIQRY